MSTIYGPQTGHATLYDTSGDDMIIAAGGYNTIYSLYGNDTISGGSAGYNTVLAGTQYDYAQRDVSIRLNGLGNTVDGGDANFTIFNSSGDSTINLGDGNDNLTLGGLDNTITVGLGADNIIAGGGDDSVTVVGVVFFLNGPTPATISVQFSGYGNSFYNGFNSTFDGSAEGYPLPVFSTITGGSGDGNFSLWGGGSVVTNGLDNNIFVGDGNYNVVAGSGDDTVSMENPFEGSMDVNVTLAGSGNSVSAGGGPLTVKISGGTGDAAVSLGDGFGTVQANVTLGGSNNTVTAQEMSGYLDPGGSGAIVDLTYGDNLDVLVHGHGDFIGLGDATNANINDQSHGLQIDVSGEASATIYNFGFDRGAVFSIDLQFGYPQPFQNADQIVAALQQTSRGAVLSYGGSGAGSFLFAGVSVSQLHASNFAV
jgi:hypothetical protein